MENIYFWHFWRTYLLLNQIPTKNNKIYVFHIHISSTFTRQIVYFISICTYRILYSVKRNSGRKINVDKSYNDMLLLLHT